MSAVGIKEGSGDVNNLLASPFEDKPGLLCHYCNRNGFQIFFCSILKELVHILRIDYHCHSFLGFGNGKLCSVKSRIFLGHLKAVCQFTDGNGYTASPEIVAFLDDPAYFSASEQSLNLTLCGRITLLYLRTTGLNGALCVYLGGSGSTATAVTACSSAEEDNDIVRIGVFSDHVLSGSRAHNGTDLHSLCHIIGMIDFLYITGSQTDLVAVGGIAACRSSHQLLLGQLALQGFGNGNRRICRAGHTHCLIYIASSR